MRHARKFIVGRLDNIRSVRRHIISWLLLVGLMMVAVGLQFVWFQRSYQTTAAAEGGTYAEALLGPIDTLDPLYASSSAEIAASKLLFSSLYSYDQTGSLRGDLSEKLETNAAGTVYTVKLKEGVQWHDGALLTAKDVEFTINLIKNPETRSSLRVNWQDVKVKAVDDYTIQFELPAVYASFPNALTFAVLPQHLLKDVAPGAIRENTFSQSPVGSGPFSFRLLQSADEKKHRIVQMSAFEKYYNGKPMLNRFEVHAYSSQEEIVKALRSGEVTAAGDLAGINTLQIDKANYTLTTQPVNSGVYAMFNTLSPILKDKAVRKALQVGTDTAEIRKSLPTDVSPLDLPFTNDQISGADVPKAVPVDIKKAQALLDQAGWIMKNGTRSKGDQRLALTVATTKNGQYEEALEALAGQWRKIGVAVNTNVIDTADPSTNFVQNILQARNYDVLLYELLIGADPDVYAYWHSSQIGVNGYNFSSYANGAADDALASARSRLEPELRNVKYKAFAKQWIDDAPAIGLYQPVSEYVYNKHTRSVDTSTKLISAYDRYTNVLDWSVNQKSVYKTP